jgi:aconitate hydratase
VPLTKAASAFTDALKTTFGKGANGDGRLKVPGTNYDLGHGDVVIAAITSCTNTSNPGVMVAAGLLARNAAKRGLNVKPWVKTSLAPGSQVVTEYLAASGLQRDLDKLGFNLVGYGCTTCIGNSGPLPDPIAETVTKGDLVAAAVLSGNRNFEGRINPHVRANYLASPPLVVAYALAGSMTTNLTTEPLGHDRAGKPVYLKDIWPRSAEVAQTIRKTINATMFRTRYADVFAGDKAWRSIKTSGGMTYTWDSRSTYVRKPPYFDDMKIEPAPLKEIERARILGIFGDSITTDHISPAGSIKKESPAGRYLIEHGVAPADFNSYGARRGNHEVMMRGTFANIRIKNEMLGGREGGNTIHYPSGEELPIYDAAMRYAAEGVPLVVFAGKEYGTGSSRDWAAKGTRLLGVRAVVAESFERIHRSNLVGMGVLPLEFTKGETRKSLGFTGRERIDIRGLSGHLKPRMTLSMRISGDNGSVRETDVLCRIDTVDEVEYFVNGGILHYVLRNLLKRA